MPMQKNGVKMHQRMDSKKEDFLSLRLNLSMTKFMLNPTEFPTRIGLMELMIGLVLNILKSLVKEEVTILLTQAVKLNWNYKIGAEINQVMVLEKTVCAGWMGNGIMIIATESIVSFVNLSN